MFGIWGVFKGGTGLPSSLFLLGSHCETPSVAVRPGAMQLTLILWGPQHTARDFVKFIIRFGRAIIKRQGPVVFGNR